MVWVRYTSAVLDAYRGSPDAAEEAGRARAHREWLESLRIDDEVRDGLVEQARAIEDAFTMAAGSTLD